MDQSGTPSPKATSPVVWIILVVVVLALAGGVFYVVSSDEGNANNANGATNANAVANANGSAANTNHANVNSGSTNATNASTSTLKTYISVNWDYSFQYPDTLSAQDYSSANSNAYDGKLLNEIIVPGPMGGDFYADVSVVDGPVEDIQQYLEKTDTAASWHEAQVGARDAIVGESIYGADATRSYYVLQWMEKSVVISCFAETCEDVIPTFTFANAS